MLLLASDQGSGPSTPLHSARPADAIAGLPGTRIRSPGQCAGNQAPPGSGGVTRLPATGDLSGGGITNLHHIRRKIFPTHSPVCTVWRGNTGAERDTMWTPDIRTLFLILFLVNVILTLMLFIFWRSQKTHHGFRTWMLSLLVTSCGYFLYLNGGSVPVLLASPVANLLITLSVMMRLDSTGRYFWSRALPGIVYCILIPAALLLLYFTFLVDSVVIRGVIIGMLIVPSFLATALIAIRSREPETGSLGTVCRVPPGHGNPLDRDRHYRGTHPRRPPLAGPDPTNPIFFIVTILMDIVATASFLMLNMARTQEELPGKRDAVPEPCGQPPRLCPHPRQGVHPVCQPVAIRIAPPVNPLSGNPSIPPNNGECSRPCACSSVQAGTGMLRPPCGRLISGSGKAQSGTA